jgi:hypothetical protein
MFKLWRIGGCERADPRVLFCRMLERAAWLAGRILSELFQAGAAWGSGVALFLQFEP